MVILDSSIVVVALPSIQRALRFSTGNLEWVLSAYLLAFGGLLLLGGRSADLLGLRRMSMLGTGLFAVASLACGLAPSSAALICARVIQGVSAAIMTPTALSILMTLFQEGSERGAHISFARASLRLPLPALRRALRGARRPVGAAAVSSLRRSGSRAAPRHIRRPVHDRPARPRRATLERGAGRA